jgi:hypothetical protein
MAVVEDERAILDTLSRYGHTIDHGPDEEWLDCFTEDGVWDARPGAGIGGAAGGILCRGQDELRAFIATHTHAPERWHKHLLVEPRIRLDGDAADVLSYWVRIDLSDAGIYMRGFGRYVDHLVRCTDGRWRIQERVIECEAMEIRGSDAILPNASPRR